MGFFAPNADASSGYFGSVDPSTFDPSDLFRPMPFGLPLPAFQQLSGQNMFAPASARPLLASSSHADDADTAMSAPADEQLAQAPPATNDNRTPEEICAKANQDCVFGALQTPLSPDAYIRWRQQCQDAYSLCMNIVGRGASRAGDFVGFEGGGRVIFRQGLPPNYVPPRTQR